MKAILKGKEIDCRIINQSETHYYIEHAKLCYYNNSTCLLNDRPDELIKQSIRERVKVDDLKIIGENE